MYRPLAEWPAYSQDPRDIEKYLYGSPKLDIDAEWNAKQYPTILGLSNGVTTVSCSWEDGAPYLAEILEKYPNTLWAGHNIVGADLFVFKRLGINIPLVNAIDTIIYHWLVNMNLCKASGKSALEEDEGERRGRGFMNLGTFASMYTDLPYWKECRGEKFCEGNPCPEHAPYFYNAMDSLSTALAFPHVQRVAKLRGVESLYPLHRDLMAVLAEMRDFGVRVDVPYIYGRDKHPLGTPHGDSLDEEFRREKTAIESTLAFNPKSPKQVVEYFRAKGVELEDATEDGIRETVEELGESAPEELVALLDYKELGNGADRWYAPEYRDKRGWLQGYLDARGYVHPNIGMFTSSTRLQCTSPNLQNVSKRRRSRSMCECGSEKAAHPTATCAQFHGEALGKRVRRAIIAPDGWYIVRADLSNAENRVALHFGGYTIERGIDLHEWVKDIAGITEDMEISLKEGSAREAAKKIQHANNNLEGLQLKTMAELRSKKIRSEIESGARKVHGDWTFRNKVVTFSGSYEARRTFGSATFENRRKVLEVNAKYTDNFPGVIDFRKRVSKDCEVTGTVRSPLGYVLLSYGDDNDRMKIAQSNWQQCPVAHVTKIALINCWERWKRQGNYKPILQCHDEVLCYVKDEVAPETAMAWLREDMEMELEKIPGLLIPSDSSYGPNWRDQKKS